MPLSSELARKIEEAIKTAMDQSERNERTNANELGLMIGHIKEIRDLGHQEHRVKAMSVAISKDVINAIDHDVCDEPAACLRLLATLFEETRN